MTGREAHSDSPAPPAGGDAFASVQAAVLAVWPRLQDPQAGPSVAERNLMLDWCGSDHRPLLELVLDLGTWVRPALANASRGGAVAPTPSAPVASPVASPAASPVASPVAARSTAEWHTLRAAHVHRIVASRYLQHEVARWAVDVWGTVVGVAPRVEPVRPAGESLVVGGHATAAPSGAGALAAAAARGAATGAAGASPGRGPTTTARVPAARVGVPPSAVPAALRNVPSWAGGPVSFGVGKAPAASTLAALAARGRVVVQHGARGPVGPMWQPVEKRAAMVFAALLVVGTVAMWSALSHRPAGPVAADTVRLSPATNAPATANANATATAEARGAPAPSVPTRERRDAPAGAAAIGYDLVPLPAAVDHARDPAGAPVPPAGPVAGRSLRERGVAGRYRVVQRVRSVSGSESCDAIAQSLGAGRVSEEVVAHTPGAPVFRIETRQVSGVLRDDGWFEAGPSAGVTNNVTWRFRMRGQFTAQGFRGDTETRTDATLSWGRQQTCVVSADLEATRLDGGS